MKLHFASILLILFLSCTNTKSTKNVAVTAFSFDSTQLVNDLQYLSSDELTGRLPGTTGSVKARNLIQTRFSSIGVDSFAKAYQHSFPLTIRNEKQPITGINVVGFIKGKKTPNKYIVVTAHYDHMGIRGERIFYGANDNASGTAALFAIASYFKKNQPDHSIIFAALDAEEQGLVGAKAFIENPPVSLSHILLNINMDMIGRDHDNVLYAVGTYHYPFLRPHLQKVATTSAVDLRFGYDKPTDKEDWTHQSDHYQFHLKKIPFIYFGVEDFANHHKHTDDFETMTLSFYAKAVETIIHSISTFDKNLPFQNKK